MAGVTPLDSEDPFMAAHDLVRALHWGAFSSDGSVGSHVALRLPTSKVLVVINMRVDNSQTELLERVMGFARRC